MRFLKLVLRLLVGCFFGVLVAYWMIFVYYTTTYYVKGGLAQVIGWYQHISGAGFQSHWNAKRFVIDQIVTLALTLALYFLWERLRDQPAKAMSKPQTAGKEPLAAE